MPRLLFLRHGEAVSEGLAGSDHERTLTLLGQEQGQRSGEFARLKGYLPEAALCSTAHRARGTLDFFLESHPGVQCDFERRLYLAEAFSYFDLFSEVAPAVKTLLLVAHNPGISEVVSQLVGERVAMPTGALAVAETSSPIAQVARGDAGRLLDYFCP